MLLPLQIPPGVYRNGTDMQSAGRWRDASLVRWHEGAMQPIGGWRERVEDTLSKPARGAVAWQDNSGDRWVAFGSYNHLWALSASGTLTQITPSGFTAGNQSATTNTGYGGGFYGTGYYGVTRPDTGIISEATTWSLDTWGQYLVGCSNADGKLYEWQLNPAANAAAISGAPTGCLGLVVTGERFLFALGAGGDPRKVQWCDQSDNTTWTAATTNQAGDQIIESDSQIMCGVPVRGQTLILTATDAHAATYVGQPFVYGFERVGTACGVISRRAAVQVDGGAIWMGPRGFHRYFGGAVEDVPCDVGDYLFRNINHEQASKIYAVTNAQFDEAWWFYPAEVDKENSAYVALNYRTGAWMTGVIDRTAGVDRGAFQTPIWTDSGGAIYDHETGWNYSGTSPYAETGPISLGNGDQTMTALHLYPDELTAGETTATFKTRFYPNDTERSYGPYSMANPTSVKFSGRQIRMRVTGDEGTNWRVGVPRLDVREGGRR